MAAPARLWDAGADPMPDAMHPSAPHPAGDTCPQPLWRALARGGIGRCPRCGRGRLFRAFLKPVDRCAACDQDWRLQRADDFPAYAALFITGHLVAPLAVHLARDSSVSPALAAAITLPVTAALAIGLLQPCKGAIIALQWRLAMHGFQADDAAP